MKLGIFAGGFKPFHNGHFAKLAVALEECEAVYVIFGKGSRKKGDNDFTYTSKMCEEIYEIVSKDLKTFDNRNKIITMMSKSSPVRDVFNIIGAHHIEEFDNDDYDKEFIRSFKEITVYTAEPEVYTKSIGTDKEPFYFGSMIKDNTLTFESDSGGLKFLEWMREYYHPFSDGDIEYSADEEKAICEDDYTKIRGSDIRSIISTGHSIKAFSKSIGNGSYISAANVKRIYDILKEGNK